MSEIMHSQGAYLASAARTATIQTPTQNNAGYRGIYLYLNVTVASGTGGLQVAIYTTGPASNVPIRVSAYSTPVQTAIGLVQIAMYPGMVTNAAFNQVVNGVLPSNFYIEVKHGDGTSYTYSLGYQLLI